MIRRTQLLGRDWNRFVVASALLGVPRQGRPNISEAPFVPRASACEKVEANQDPMETAEIDKQMLTEMPAMRTALVQHFTWYYHVTPLRNVASIRVGGLRPRRDKAI